MPKLFSAGQAETKAAREVLIHSCAWNFRFAPGAQIHSVEHQAEHVGWYETQLLSFQTYDADDDAIHCCQDPAFPTSTPNQDRRNNGQHARHIIQTKHNVTSVKHYLARAGLQAVTLVSGPRNGGNWKGAPRAVLSEWPLFHPAR
jgi:hypothetical protein